MSIVQVGANNYSLDSRVVVEGLASTINEFYGYMTLRILVLVQFLKCILKSSKMVD